MNHLSDTQLMHCLQGRPLGREFTALEEHVQTCRACQERLADLRSVWNVLGTWTTPLVSAGLEKRILQTLPEQTRFNPSVQKWQRSLHVAAALALAIGVGHVAGRETWKPVAPEPVDETAAAESLHLDDPDSADILLAVIDAPEGDRP